MSHHFFAPCPRGLEAALAAELNRLGAENPEETPGGVAFSGDWLLVYRCNLESRLASRILWRIASAPYRNEHDIYALTLDIDWTQYFDESRTLRVDLTATHSPLTSLAFATLRIKDAICDRFRQQNLPRPSVNKHAPDVRVAAYLTDRNVSLYLDTSGEALFKRGYRKNSEDAPLRENLAAGLLALTGWTPDTPLLDPFCGSGTIAIEAALIAAGIAPGIARAFGFQKLKQYDGPTWQRLKQKARDAVISAMEAPTIFACDLSSSAIARARVCAASAQVSDWIQFNTKDAVDQSAPAENGIWLTNPPYGVRLEDSHSLTELYPKIGRTLKHEFAGWQAWFLSADKKLPGGLGLKAERRIPLFNGALDCRLYGFKMIAGSMRRTPSGNTQ